MGPTLYSFIAKLWDLCIFEHSRAAVVSTSPVMHDLYCHLKDHLKDGGVVTPEEIEIASGAAVFTPERVKKIITETAVRSQRLEEAFQKQKEQAAVSNHFLLRTVTE